MIQKGANEIVFIQNSKRQTPETATCSLTHQHQSMQIMRPGALRDEPLTPHAIRFGLSP
jgi:hypothetical protein